MKLTMKGPNQKTKFLLPSLCLTARSKISTACSNDTGKITRISGTKGIKAKQKNNLPNLSKKEPAMKKLEKALPAIVDTVMEPEKKTAICSAGLGTNATTAITPYLPQRRPQMDEVPAIVSKLRSTKLWAIRPEDQTDTNKALKILAWTTIEAKYDECTYWIARMLAHFPAREVTKDGVIIADIASACVEEKASLVAVAFVCDELWKQSTKENPWLPPSGEVLKAIKERTESYRNAIERFANPKVALPPPKAPEPPPDPYQGRKWEEFTDEDHERFAEQYHELMPTLRPIWRRLYEVPEDAEITNPNERTEDHELEHTEETTNPDTEKAESGSAESLVAEPNKSANQQGETGAHENAAS